MRLYLAKYQEPDGTEMVICDTSLSNAYMQIAAYAQNAGADYCQTAKLLGPDPVTIQELYVEGKILPLFWCEHRVPRPGNGS